MKGTVVALLALVLGAAPNGVPIATNASALAPALRGAHVAVLVPTRVPAVYGKTYATASTYASKGLPAAGYSIVLGAVPGCDGTACEYADVQAGPASLVEHGAGRPVTLVDGSRATFVRRGCGANCAGSGALWFRRGTTYYAIAGKADSLSELLIIANSLKPLSR